MKLFKDISSWAKEAIDVISRAEIINGYVDGTFRPQNNATRAEASTMIWRFIKHVVTQSTFTTL